jgi:hypothetical protein
MNTTAIIIDDNNDNNDNTVDTLAALMLLPIVDIPKGGMDTRTYCMYSVSEPVSQ